VDRVLSSEQEKSLIEWKGVIRDYSLGSHVIHALRNVTLKIRSGEFVGVMGPSASGKSTLLNIIGCLDSPTGGEYFLREKNIGLLNAHEKALLRNNCFGFVFQSFNLLPDLDVASNVALPLKYGSRPKSEWKALVEEALKAVGLEDAAQRYPDQLSGGQQQRVAIARALVNKPDVILADEPTGNLDLVTGQGIMETFRKLNKQSGTTIIVVTHDVRIAGYADRLILIEDGCISRDICMDRMKETGSLLNNPFRDFDMEDSYEKIL